MGIQVTITTDAAALGGLAKRWGDAAAFLAGKSPEAKTALFGAAQILVGEVREAVMTTLRGDGVRTGALARSFRERVDVARGHVAIAAESDLIYARIQDQGGTIGPGPRRLAIPIKRLPVGKWPRHFPRGELFTLSHGKRSRPTEEGLFRKRGKRGKLELVYWLKPTVRIEPKHYLAKAAVIAQPLVAAHIARAFAKGLRGG